MGLHDNYRNVYTLRQHMKSRKNEDNLKKSKEIIRLIIKKRMTTCFIGSIDSIEETFGKYWGKNLDGMSRTPQQTQVYKLWMDLRAKILDKGNTQLRNLLKEIDNFDVDYQGEEIYFNNGDFE